MKSLNELQTVDQSLATNKEILNHNLIVTQPKRHGELHGVTKTTLKEYIQFFWLPAVLSIILIVFLWETHK